MKKAYVIGAVVLFVLAVVIGAFSLRRAREMAPGKDFSQPMPVPPGMDTPVMPRPDQPVAKPPVDDSNGMTQVIATKTFVDGTHTVSGVIALPTPCHQLTTEARVMESFPEQVVIDINIVDTGAICIQVIDERPWQVQVQASEQATFRATFNGKPAALVFDDMKL